MNRFLKIFVLFSLVTLFILGGCTASKKGCGCPSKKGLVGY